MRSNPAFLKISWEAPMATVDKQGVVTMQELIASSLAQTRRIDQTPHREGYNHQGGVHGEAIG